ncbi:MAG: hypothetical protein JRJ44_08555 [Deltaproteobacteria bacterium]|nr:hypothetical protein [Deltaproteobacteria bacterium]
MPKNKTPEPPLDPSNMERFFDLQKHELMLRTEELSLHKTRDENQKEIAEKAITANLEDRERERSYLLRNNKYVFVWLTIIVIIVLSFAGYIFYLGKEESLIELAKYIFTLSVGVIGGKGIERLKRNKKQSSSN